jgi:hypothetical protein
MNINLELNKLEINHVPKLVTSSEEGSAPCMGFDLVGPNLLQVMMTRNRPFSQDEVIAIGVEMIEIIE